MKRSKIFLGVTTGILAIAGVAAANKFGGSKTRLFCTQVGSKYCVTSSSFVYTSTGAGTGITTLTTNGHTNISVPVYTQGTVGSLCSTTNCIHQLVNVGN